MRRQRFVTILFVWSVLFASALGCSQGEQQVFNTQVAPPLKTQAGYVQKTAAAFAKTQAAALASTGIASAGTQASGAAETALASANRQLQTQAARWAPSQTPAPPGTPQLPDGKRIHTIKPPFASCEKEQNHTQSPAKGSLEILKQGFSRANAACNAEKGLLRTSVLVMGGQDGSIFKDPDQEASASAAIVTRYTPDFTGQMTIRVIMEVTAKTGAAAGSATMIPDVQDLVKMVLIKNELIGMFVDVAEGLVLGTFGGVKTEAFLQTDGSGGQQEVRAYVTGHGFGASFPIPPNSQTQAVDKEKTVLLITVPVEAGQTIQIKAGLATSALTKGWAAAFWNGLNKDTSVVRQVEIYQVQP